MEEKNIPNTKTNLNINKLAVSLAALGIVGVSAYTILMPKEPSVPTFEVSVTEDKSDSADPYGKKMIVSPYKDGTYSKTGNYITPGGPEVVDVKLTLKNGIVQDLEVTNKAKLEASIKFQNQFIGGVKEVVVGKNISDLELDKVSGSSLTPKGFNDAVSKIKAEAQS